MIWRLGLVIENGMNGRWPQISLIRVEDSCPACAPLLNLFMDYETFGEHQWAESGDFRPFEDFVALSADGNTFIPLAKHWTSCLAGNKHAACNVGGRRADLTAWMETFTERSLRYVYELEDEVFE